MPRVMSSASSVRKDVFVRKKLHLAKVGAGTSFVLGTSTSRPVRTQIATPMSLGDKTQSFERTDNYERNP